MKQRRSGSVLAIVVIIGVLVIVVVSTISRGSELFALDSAAPDGMKATRLLLEANGVKVTPVLSGSPKLANAGEGSVVYVPLPQMMSRRELNALIDTARAGAVVIYGSMPPLEDLESSESSPLTTSYFDRVPNSVLVETPAMLVPPKTCDIAELAGLGRIDSVFGSPIEIPMSNADGLPRHPTVVGRCYGSLDNADFVEVDAGKGRMFVMSSPYLWANARLQPAKETGGSVLDNGVTALALLTARADDEIGSGDGTDSSPREVLVVRAIESAESIAGGTKDPLELLPSQVKGLLIALAGALGLFIWSRSVRLGYPVDESAEVKINSSELTAAIGRLFEDDSSYLDQGAGILRRQARETCAADVGLPANTDPETLCRVLARRSARTPSEIYELLFSIDSGTTNAEVRELERRIEQLRTEVGNVNAP